MALVFCDGFDHYQRVDLLRKWTTAFQLSITEVNIGPDYARQPGGMGLYMLSAGDRRLEKTFPSTSATLIAGFNAYFLTQGNSGGFFAFLDGTSEQVSLRRNGSGNLLISRNGTTLATSTNVFSINTWYHIEIFTTINNASGVYEVRVNGSSTGWIPNATGANTRTTSNNYGTGVRLWQNDGIWYVDDFYVLDSTGSVSNTFVGPTRIITTFPNAVGAHGDWTGNYSANFANVNETAGDGDITFNQSGTANAIDTFGFDDVPSGTIHGIQQVLMARQDAGSARTIAPVIRLGGTDYVGNTKALPGTHLFITEPVTLNPDTSSQWTASEVNDGEYGYKLIS